MEKKFLKVGNNINFKFNTDGLEYEKKLTSDDCCYDCCCAEY